MEVNSCIILYEKEFVPGSSLISFDLDDTLSPRGMSIWSAGIVEYLTKLRAAGVSMIIFTNQAQLGRGYPKEPLLERVAKLMDLLGFKIPVFIAARRDMYRKPYTGMWKLAAAKFAIPDDITFIGDAAGRENDFSCSDRLFAHNIGAKFHTPEYILTGVDKVERFQYDDYLQTFTITNGILQIPKDALFQYNTTKKLYSPDEIIEQLQPPFLVFVIGLPASGKSTFSQSAAAKIANTVIISQDAATPAKCQKQTVAAAAMNTNIIIDNTNLTIEHRKRYSAAIGNAKYNYYHIVMTTPVDVCKHLNAQRKDNNVRHVPEIVYSSMLKNITIPDDAIFCGFNVEVKKRYSTR